MIRRKMLTLLIMMNFYSLIYIIIIIRLLEFIALDNKEFNQQILNI